LSPCNNICGPTIIPGPNPPRPPRPPPAPGHPARHVPWSPLGRHRSFIVNLRSSDHKKALLGFARKDDFAVLAALERRFEAIQPQFAFLPFFAVAPEARRFEERANIFGIGDTFLAGRRRELGEVEFGEIHLVSSHDGPPGGREAHYEQCLCAFYHFL
jgi:hypothetical protein